MGEPARPLPLPPPVRPANDTTPPPCPEALRPFARQIARAIVAKILREGVGTDR